MAGGVGDFPHGGIGQGFDNLVELQIDEQSVTYRRRRRHDETGIPSEIQNGIDDHQRVEDGIGGSYAAGNINDGRDDDHVHHRLDV